MPSRFPLPAGYSREKMEVDAVIVGGGAAGLSAALSLKKQIDLHNQKVKGGQSGPYFSEPSIIVLEKASEIGGHSLSGAVLNPEALSDLIPDFREKGCPILSEVKEDYFYYLTNQRAIPSPFVPPPLKNRGNLICSLSQFNRWLGKMCEESGIMIFPGFTAADIILEGDQVLGVITGDKGRDKEGNPRAHFEPGLEIRAKVTIFADGTRSPLFKHLARALNLRSRSQPETFEEGVKEVIQCPPGSVKPGQVIHTLGYPFKHSMGGGFLYTAPNDQIILGLVAYLDSSDPLLDPHRELQRLKRHPFIFKMIQGGEVIAYGGKTLPAGGWYAMPQLAGNGWMVCGDSASMVDVQKLKGIHLAMWAGIFAGQVACKALVKSDYSFKTLSEYSDKVRAKNSPIYRDLYPVRNFHQALSQGFLSSIPIIGLQLLTRGRGLIDPMPTVPDYQTTEPVIDVWGPDGMNNPDFQLPKADGKLFFDKLSSVYLTGTRHDEHSPNHLLVKNRDTCRTVCEPKFKSPCTHFCPANVYEMLPSKDHPGQKELVVNYTNCIHCQTCDIKCPFDNIDWTLPEGGGGPQYQIT